MLRKFALDAPASSCRQVRECRKHTLFTLFQSSFVAKIYKSYLLIDLMKIYAHAPVRPGYDDNNYPFKLLLRRATNFAQVVKFGP